MPTAQPGEVRKIKLDLPGLFLDGDVLEIKCLDNNGVEVCIRTFPIKTAGTYYSGQVVPYHSAGSSLRIDGNATFLVNDNLEVVFDNTSGLLQDIMKGGISTSFKHGPIPIGMKYQYKGSNARVEAGDAIFTAYYSGMIDSIQWRLGADGMLPMTALLLNKAIQAGGFDDAVGDGKIVNFGFSFDYPEKDVASVEWFGRGPYRVWKNRIAGTNYGLWRKDYNNTITGESVDRLVYPEFKGYHANLYWCRFIAPSPFTVYSGSEQLFFRLFTPEEPKGKANGENTMPDFPSGDISFLYEIPAIRDFKPVSQHGPNSQPGSIRIKKGDEGIRMILHFDFN